MADVVEKIDGKVIHRFVIGELPYVYSDALLFTEEVYDALSQADIDALKQERYSRWESMLNAPPEDII
jgi:hypothetical protein